jgi:mRNA interferase MazF
MNPKPSRGDIWQVDMGIAGKVRPCLLLTDYPNDEDLALVTIIPHTTALRGNSWEITIEKPFLKSGAFHLQQVQSISLSKLMRRLGYLTQEEWGTIGARLALRLGLAL